MVVPILSKPGDLVKACRANSKAPGLVPEHLKELFDRSKQGLTKGEQETLAGLLNKHSSLFAVHCLDLDPTSIRYIQLTLHLSFSQHFI